MVIHNLQIESFRNYRELNLDLNPGVNLICGDNAQGKTNLLEAVYYLSCGHGFRTRKEAELIRFNADFCSLQAEVDGKDRRRTLRAVMFAGRRPRQLFLNGVKQKSFSGMAGLLNTVLFCPEDLSTLKRGAAERRGLLDEPLCQLRPKYAAALEEYRRLLQEKNAVLRDAEDRPELLELLPDYNERMAQTGAIVISLRAKYLRELERHASSFHREFSGDSEELRLEYKTVSTVTDPFAPPRELYERLREHQQSHYRAEIESRQCLSGPHKDDFEALLNGISVRSFGSQGQTRTAAISLKLAERQIFSDDTGETPVLLLDDVLSELDAGRQDFVLNKIKTGQVLITSCDTRRLTDIGMTVFIRNGAMERRD